MTTVAKAGKKRSAALNQFSTGTQAGFHVVLGLFALLCIIPFIFVQQGLAYQGAVWTESCGIRVIM